MNCPVCNKEIKNKAGLASHLRAKHPQGTEPGSVEQAVRSDVEGIGTASFRLAALALARAIDETMSARELPALTKELRATLDQIGVGKNAQEADFVDELAARRDAKSPRSTAVR